MDDPLELAALILIWTAVVPSLFRSVQDMVLGNRSSRVILTLVGTGSLFLVFAGGSAFSSYTDYKIKQLMIKTNQNSIATLTSAYATELKNFPPETTLRQRSEASIAIASIIFTSGGDLVKYINARGEWKQYIPSKSDLNMRDGAVSASSGFQAKMWRDLAICCFWSLSASLTIFLGWYSGRLQRKWANLTVNPDAPTTSAPVTL
jgi:hypothetical protein